MQAIERRAAIVLDNLIREHDRLTRAIEHPQVRSSAELLSAERNGIRTALAYMTGAYGVNTPYGTTSVEGWLPALREAVAASKESIK